MNALKDYLKEIVYGGTDGIITTFAVVAGFSGASLGSGNVITLSFLTVLLFGLANLFADAFSMGLGNFLSIKAGRDIYKNQFEMLLNKIDEEADDTKKLLNETNMSASDIKNQISIFKSNKVYWAKWLMQYKYKIEDSSNVNPIYTGLATFISFIIFGAIPLIPFTLVSENTSIAFTYSSLGVVIALCLLAILKWKVVDTGLLRSILEMVVIGGTAAIVAFLVGTFFSL